MSNQCPDTKGYPSREDVSEQHRLHANQDLIAHAFGSRVLCPIDLRRSNLRILDSGTADGYWLHTIRPLLQDASSAVLIGTDLNPVWDSDRTFDRPDNMTFQQHDLRHPWPADWTSSFDLVNQRLALFVAGTFESAVTAVQNLLALLKPKGHIVLVEGYMPKGQLSETDAPHQKVLTMLGNFAQEMGMDPNRISSRLNEVLRCAAEKAERDGMQMGEMEERRVKIRYGTGAAEDDLKEKGMVQAVGLSNSLDWLKAKHGDMECLRWWNAELRQEFLRETQEVGWEMEVTGLWAQRVR